MAINDLTEAGAQPIAGGNGRFAMVFNGEIYNYPELRDECEARGHVFTSHMDGEVILHCFEDDGPAGFAKLNGIFAVAILDTLSGELVLARDPLGVKPLFVSTAGDDLHFASELRALAATGATLGDYDLVAMAQFLTFLWVPAPRSPFEGASALLPGHYLTWREGKATTARYCEPLYPTVDTLQLTPEQAVAAGRDLISAAARRQLLSDVPVGLMASGGIDSGLLWWATQGSLHKAFTIAWDQSGPEGLEEDLAGVRRLQQLYGTAVTEIQGQDTGLEDLPLAGDLFADPAFALTRIIAQRAREAGVPVLLSGQGGDELFGGYRRHQVARLVDRLHLGRAGTWAGSGLNRLPVNSTSVEYAARLALALGERDPFRGYMQLSTYSNAEDRARALDCTTSEVSDDMVWQEHQKVYDSLPTSLPFTRKAMALDLNVYMPGLGLAYVDRAGMEHGIEIRVPWLDLELVRWSLKLPLDLLIHARQGKWLSRQVAKQVLPQATARAPKRGFGAPSSELTRDTAEGAHRGFRQGVYFSRAKRLLAEHRETVGPKLLRG